MLTFSAAIAGRLVRAAMIKAKASTKKKCSVILNLSFFILTTSP